MLSLFLAIVFILHLWTYLKRLKYSHIPQLPISPGLWWFPGHLPMMKEKPYLGIIDPDCPTLDLTRASLMMIKQLESNTITFFIYNNCFIFSIDIEFASVYFSSKNFMKPCNPNIVKPNGISVFGEKGILTEPGTEIWNHKRKTMDPAFQKKFLKALNSDMHILAGRICNFIESLPSTSNLEVYDIFMKSALEVVCRCGFNLETKILECERSPINDAVNDVFACVQDSFDSHFLYKLPWVKRQSKNLLKKQCGFLRSFMREHLQSRLDSIQNGTDSTNDILSYIIRCNYDA